MKGIIITNIAITIIAIAHNYKLLNNNNIIIIICLIIINIKTIN